MSELWNEKIGREFQNKNDSLKNDLLQKSFFSNVDSFLCFITEVHEWPDSSNSDESEHIRSHNKYYCAPIRDQIPVPSN